MRHISFHEAQISWNDTFFVCFFYANSIWNTMKKDAVLNSYFPITQRTCGYGITKIKSKAAVLKFLLNSCSENFRKFTINIPVVQSFF